jgi:Ca2+-binding RTX toxin-like protein
MLGDGFNNRFTGNGGDDNLNGAGGADMADYANAPGGVTVNLATRSSSGAAGNDTLIGFANARGSKFDDVLIGSLNANRLIGLAGNDSITGGEGTDTADGGDDTDTCDAEVELNCEADPPPPA